MPRASAGCHGSCLWPSCMLRADEAGPGLRPLPTKGVPSLPGASQRSSSMHPCPANLFLSSRSRFISKAGGLRGESLRAGGVTHISRHKSLGPGAVGCRPSHRACLPPPVYTRTAHCSCGGGGSLTEVGKEALAYGQGWERLVPGSEENLEGDGIWGCIDQSCLQQPTVRRYLEGHRVLIWLLLACTEGREHTEHGQLQAPPREPPPHNSGVRLWSGPVLRGKATPGSPGLWGPAIYAGSPGGAHRGGGSGGQAQPTHQHSPVAPTAAQVHEVDLPDPLLIHKAGPEVHAAGGELQLGNGHRGPQGHHLGGQSLECGVLVPSCRAPGQGLRDTGPC